MFCETLSVVYSKDLASVLSSLLPVRKTRLIRKFDYKSDKLWAEYQRINCTKCEPEKVLWRELKIFHRN
jgi:hypothetical protein